MNYRSITLWLVLGSLGKLITSNVTRRFPQAAVALNNGYHLRSDFRITDKKTTRKYEFVITNTTAAPDGFWRRVLAINNQIPGPLIEVCMLLSTMFFFERKKTFEGINLNDCCLNLQMT